VWAVVAAIVIVLTVIIVINISDDDSDYLHSDTIIEPAKTEKTEKKIVVTNAMVDDLLKKPLSQISKGRELKKKKIVIGDLNGDNLDDAIVQINLEPTFEDTGGGNVLLWDISYYVVFINTGNDLKIEAILDNYYIGEDGFGNILNISNGLVQTENHEYTEEDSRCCPTLKCTKLYKYRNDKLVFLSKDCVIDNDY